jgi:hypothetical protein
MSMIPKKPAPDASGDASGDAIRGGNRFLEQIMLQIKCA